MTDFRKFCIGGFVGSGFFAAMANRGAAGTNATQGSVEAILQVIAVLLVVGCATVAVFGGKRND